jgi:hypothetical protein
LSLDEVTAIDNMLWVCMHVYTIQNNVRQLHLLFVGKLRDNAKAETLFQLVKRNLIEYGAMDELTIVKKLVCVGADGASVMQGEGEWSLHKDADFLFTICCWHSLYGP